MTFNCVLCVDFQASTRRRPLAQRQQQWQPQYVVVNHAPAASATSASAAAANNNITFTAAHSNDASADSSLASVGPYSDFVVSTTVATIGWLVESLMDHITKLFL